MSVYERAEREVLRDLALRTLNDPTAPHEAHAAARARLLRSEPDMKRLSTPEVRQLVEAMRTVARLMAKARGESAPRTVVDYPEPAPAPTLIEQLGLGDR